MQVVIIMPVWCKARLLNSSSMWFLASSLILDLIWKLSGSVDVQMRRRVVDMCACTGFVFGIFLFAGSFLCQVKLFSFSVLGSSSVCVCVPCEYHLEWVTPHIYCLTHLCPFAFLSPTILSICSPLPSVLSSHSASLNCPDLLPHSSPSPFLFFQPL